MPWEVRGEKRYYYRSQRVAGRVKRVYVGCGPAAVRAASGDDAARRQKQRAKIMIEQIEADVASALLLTRELDEGLRMLTAGSLLSAGYHQHRGHWRKYRVKDT